SGQFQFVIDAVDAAFKYRVVAGALTSPIYAITLARPPRGAKIDVEYAYPPELPLANRTEEGSRDIYAPPRPDRNVRVHTDHPASTGQMVLADGKAIPLSGDGGTVLSAGLKVVDNNSYRIAIADGEGLKNPGDTEYFIRMLADRPPDVHIVKPARDR